MVLPEKVDIRSLDELAIVEIAKILGMDIRVDDKDGVIAEPEYCIDDISSEKLMKAHEKGEIYLGDNIAILNSKTGKPIKYARTAMNPERS